MHDVLVVDDDPIIREGLCKMIESFPGDKTLHQASNGEEALECICLGRIDIVFADIKMPICDGLDMLRRLREIPFWGEVVMISGYDDFAYAKEAMKYGAADYILKPVSTAELRAVYQNIHERLIRREKRKPEVSLAGAIQERLYKEQALLDRFLEPGAPIADLLSQVGCQADAQSFVVLLDILGKGSVSNIDRQAAYLTGEAIRSACVKTESTMLQGAHRQLWTILLLAKRGHPSPLPAMVQYLQGEGIRFGSAPSLYPASKTSEAIEAAIRDLETFFYDTSPGEVPEAEASSATLEHLAEAAVAQIAARDSEQAQAALRVLFDQLASRKPLVDQARQLLASIVYAAMRRNKEFIGVVGKFKFTQNDILQAIQDSSTISTLRKVYIGLIQHYIASLDEHLQGKENYAIQKVKSYLKAEYAGNVSLADIANRLGLHPSYVSTMFRQKTGQTFSEYLRTLRIDKAVEYMRLTNMKNFEIAQQVGYPDNAQFYRAFKQVTGVSPGDYKRGLLG